MRQVMQNPNFPTSDPGAQTISYLVGNTGNLTAHAPRTGRSSSHALALPGTSRVPASTCCVADTASPATRSSRTSRLFSIQQTQPIIYQTVFDQHQLQSRPARGTCSSPTRSGQPLYLPVRRDPAAVPPPPTQTDLAFGAVPRIVKSRPLPIRGRSSSVSATPGRLTTTMRSRWTTFTSSARMKSASSTRTR